MPKFLGTKEVTTEEHIELFYNYADKLNITHDDV